MTKRYRLQCHPRFAPDDAVSTVKVEYPYPRLAHPPCPSDPPALTFFAFSKKYSFQGRYDDLKTAQENIDLQTTILSRFDLIFIVRDERLYERDLAIADHVLGIHAGHGGEIATDGSIVPVGQDKNPEAERQVKFLKRYVEYCRATCSPRLVPTSAKLLEDSYVRYRQEMRERAKKGGAPAVPITVRQLEAITRVSESLEDDAAEAGDRGARAGGAAAVRGVHDRRRTVGRRGDGGADAGATGGADVGGDAD